jgi:hypothetical protein
MRTALFLYLAQRGAYFLIAVVKHGSRKGFSLIRDRLIYARWIPWRTSRLEVNGALTSPGPCGPWLRRSGRWSSSQAAPRSSLFAAMVFAMARRPLRPVTTSQACEPVPRLCCLTSETGGKLGTVGTGCGKCRCGKTPSATVRTTVSRSLPRLGAWRSMPCGSMGFGRSPR